MQLAQLGSDRLFQTPRVLIRVKQLGVINVKLNMKAGKKKIPAVSTVSLFLDMMNLIFSSPTQDFRIFKLKVTRLLPSGKCEVC